MFNFGEYRFSRFDDLSFVTQGLARMFGGKKICIRFSDRLGWISNPKLLCTTLADPDKSAVGILEVDGIGNGIE